MFLKETIKIERWFDMQGRCVTLPLIKLDMNIGSDKWEAFVKKTKEDKSMMRASVAFLCHFTACISVQV